MTRHLDLVDRFQCPGCPNGTDTTAGCYQAESLPRAGEGCANHVPGTLRASVGPVLLGMPPGFDRIGPGRVKIRIFTTRPAYDQFNVAVWAKREEDVVLVRVYQPRLNATYVDVLDDDGPLPPNAINVTNVEMD